MHVNAFYLNGLFKDPITKYSLILMSWGLGAQHLNLGGGGGVGTVSPGTSNLTTHGVQILT